jgi:ubiquinone/menaquinone biosynthesis C-methylase UbiE
MSFDSNKFKSAQRQGWDNAATGWKNWWEVIEKGAQKINDRLIDLAKIKQGDKVLDLATGIGEPAITAAKKLAGSQGHILAVDISPQMISFARQRAESLGLQNIIEFKEGDIESLQLQPLSFDAVLCRWGLMFLPNLDDTLKNIFNALKEGGGEGEGGKLATAVWSSQSNTPFVGFPMSIILRELNVPSPSPNISMDSTSLNLGPCSLADENILKNSLGKAGFKDIQIERQNVTFEFASANDYVNHVRDIAAPLKSLLDKESEKKQEEIWKVVAKEVKDNFTNTDDGSVIMNNECICFAAAK